MDFINVQKEINDYISKNKVENINDLFGLFKNRCDEVNKLRLKTKDMKLNLMYKFINILCTVVILLAIFALYTKDNNIIVFSMTFGCIILFVVTLYFIITKYKIKKQKEKTIDTMAQYIMLLIVLTDFNKSFPDIDSTTKVFIDKCGMYVLESIMEEE